MYVEPAAYDHVEDAMRQQAVSPDGSCVLGPVMTWVEQHGCHSIPDEVAHDLDFVVVLGGEGGQWLAWMLQGDQCLLWYCLPVCTILLSVLAINCFVPQPVLTASCLCVPGDGTLLWTCHIFGNRAVPPLVPFNHGSLGFLTPFPPSEMEQIMQKTLDGRCSMFAE